VLDQPVTVQDHPLAHHVVLLERGIPVTYRAAFLGHREEVNESNYETEMAISFMRERLGKSMAPEAA